MHAISGANAKEALNASPLRLSWQAVGPKNSGAFDLAPIGLHSGFRANEATTVSGWGRVIYTAPNADLGLSQMPWPGALGCLAVGFGALLIAGRRATA